MQRQTQIQLKCLYSMFMSNECVYVVRVGIDSNFCFNGVRARVMCMCLSTANTKLNKQNFVKLLMCLNRSNSRYTLNHKVNCLRCFRLMCLQFTFCLISIEASIWKKFHSFSNKRQRCGKSDRTNEMKKSNDKQKSHAKQLLDSLYRCEFMRNVLLSSLF